MSTLYLIRHGQASFGAANYDLLSPTGERQAEMLARRLSCRELRFDAVVRGTMVRHRQTMEPFLAAYRDAGLDAPEPRIMPEFDEFDAAAIWQHVVERMIREDPEVKQDLERVVEDTGAFVRIYKKVLTRWAEGRVDPGLAPTWEEFTARVRRGVRALADGFGPGKRVAVFTSGGPICAAMQMALDLSSTRAMELGMRIYNASITRLRYDGEGVCLFSHNDASHLEIPGEKDLLTFR